jgi:hypothetical protein
MEAKQLLVRVTPPEPALAVGDEAVHRNAHGVDQQGFELVAPKRRTMVVMKFTIELEIRLFFPLVSALPKLKTDRNTTTHRVDGPSNSTAIVGAAPRSRSGTRSGLGQLLPRAEPAKQGDAPKTRPVIRPGNGTQGLASVSRLVGVRRR